jgi:Family of unknown function (DUF6510)
MSNDSFVDGNAAAGELLNVFCMDVTDADGQCAACGNVAALAQSRVYGLEPGIVLRCVVCEHPLMRMTRGAGRTWIDVRGLTYLELRTPHSAQ